MPGDVLLINKMSLGPAIPFTKSRLFSINQPERGDIIVFYPPGIDDQYVKRVVGLPGDRIHVKGAQVYINGELLHSRFQESGTHEILMKGIETLGNGDHEIQLYSDRPVYGLSEEIQVPQGHYFVMGDFRNNSQDSRIFGTVPEENIIGRTRHILFSLSDSRSLFDSIGEPLR